MSAPLPNEAAPAVPRSKLRAVVSVLAGALALLALGYVFHAQRAELARALDFDVRILVLLGGTAFGAHLLRALEYDALLVRLGVKERWVDGFLLTGAVQLLNYLPFSAGEVVRAVSLRRTRALAYPVYAGALAVAALMNTLLAGVGGAAISLLVGGPWHGPLFGVFLALAVVSVLGLVVPSLSTPRGTSRLSAMRRQMHEGLVFVRTRRVLFLLGAVSAAKFVLNALRVKLGFVALGQPISWANAALLGSASVLSSLVNLAPGNLGVRELVLGAAAGAAGGSPAIAMAAASLDRAVMLAYTVVTGLPGLAHWQRTHRP